MIHKRRFFIYYYAILVKTIKREYNILLNSSTCYFVTVRFQLENFSISKFEKNEFRFYMLVIATIHDIKNVLIIIMTVGLIK